ncbi:putative GTP-binding protein 1 [Blattamonas nauphoetae]|uniref:GTP-binding protein 1 n=1 Tax=Blattamonas nauphoetae TaxID=2049346 RepID=A0ABQ9XXK6_9EUKA|nr:putative GTP-binding protein 1 [Blattamonas nauphoetae]
MSITQKIKDIENELSRTQKNKRTEYHIGLLKGKLARYRAQLVDQIAKSGGGASGASFEVAKSGDARVALVGFPSVGKSSLLNLLTDSESAIAQYEFTTLTCVPGFLTLHGARIQILDLPGIIRGASAGKGRGRQVIATARSADLIVMVLDAGGHPKQKEYLTAELETMGIRVNRQKPNIGLRVKTSGGVQINSTVPLTQLTPELIKHLIHDYKIFHCELLFHEDAAPEDLIDIIELHFRPSSRQYLRCMYVYNKIDITSMEELNELAHQEHTAVISCELKLNLDNFVRQLWNELGLVRVYTKTRGADPDFVEGLVMFQGATVNDVCLQIHRNLPSIVKHVLVWGRSAKYNPQQVGLTHQIEDEDVIEVVKRITAD